MKDLRFKVNEQELKLDNKRCGNGFIVEGSRNYLRLKFDFKNWDEYEKHIHFIEGDDHYDFLLDEDDSIKVPNSFIEDKSFKFLLVGYNLEADERVTTNTLQLKLLPTEFSDDIHSYEDDTEDVYHYLVTFLDDCVQKSDTAGLLKNDGSVDTTHYLSSADLSDYVEKSDTEGLLKNDGTVDTTSYSTFSGSYDDLSNKPSIPSKISDLDNDSDFIETSSTEGLVKNDGSIDTTSYSTFDGNYNSLSNKPSIPSSSSDLSDGSDLIKKNNTQGLIKNDGTVDTSTYATKGYVDELVGEAISYIVGSEE